jgi:hypothetical protein
MPLFETSDRTTLFYTDACSRPKATRMDGPEGRVRRLCGRPGAGSPGATRHNGAGVLRDRGAGQSGSSPNAGGGPSGYSIGPRRKPSLKWPASTPRPTSGRTWRPSRCQCSSSTALWTRSRPSRRRCRGPPGRSQGASMRYTKERRTACSFPTGTV